VKTANWTAIAATTLALGVVVGAFGAHALRDSLDSYHQGVYETGVLYHYIHALGLLATPLLLRAGLITETSAKWAAWLLLIGIVFFSGSLYALAISGVAILGAITPIGGLCFIAAWFTLAWGAISAEGSPTQK
jgi:uncharacterized membrane protein YgdD (TMEM256/DUF423 family)